MKLYKLLAYLSAIVVGAKALVSYLDPGSGSLIVQILVALLVGILATFRLWRSRLLSLFGIKRDEEDDDEGEADE